MSPTDIWNANIHRLKEKVPDHVFDTWICPIRPGDYKDGVFTLYVPDRFFGERIQENYHQLIVQELREVTQDEVRVDLIVKEPPTSTPSTTSSPAIPLSPTARTTPGDRRSGILLRYVFGGFVVGPSNQFAYAASRRVAEKPGRVYNPLYIYGGVGLGKTHLLNAIGNEITNNALGRRVAYVSSEKFTNEVINSIRYNRMGDLRNRYRTMDALLIDDIQFLAGKERTQEEFFHTFNALYDMNKQIVISSDRSTKDMLEMEERLRSRFEMGLIADIHPPDLETKIAIVRKKSEQEGLEIDPEVAHLVASSIHTNIRELEGALVRLEAFSSLTGERITVDLARRVLSDVLQHHEKVITVDEIQRVVSDHHHVRVSDLKSKRRTKVLVIPRQISMYLCRKLTNLSYPEIGRKFGGKDHTTVIHAVRHVEKRRTVDRQLKNELDELRRKIQIGNR